MGALEYEEYHNIFCKNTFNSKEIPNLWGNLVTLRYVLREGHKNLKKFLMIIWPLTLIYFLFS